MFEIARVRIHTGNTAPNTYFDGLKGADSKSAEFGYDFVNIVNLTAPACTAVFQIAMDGLIASQMVAYLRGLSGHVLRNHKQVLSCAFNINMPFTDDLTAPNEDGSFKVHKFAKQPTPGALPAPHCPAKHEPRRAMRETPARTGGLISDLW
ncbi:hypothetical protein CALVIDRAFT_589568 [Calocera viscosa TUFC12733]|uniref:Uncharacterized protein n=1 Tax=Calocera viscosa (strain TUFC12733) TaxID=1330018 RepID=A0A167GW92_CALVF|nr:hypothetical protein CALVIDRAFT_589568 [Calocera viscosa TUFC12733]